LERKLEEAGVEQAVVCPVATRPEQVSSINRWAASLQGGRCIPLGALHPRMEKLEEEVAWLRDHGIRGVKLQPHFQSFALEEPETLRMLEVLEGMVILVHGGQEIKAIERVPTTPPQLLTVWERFPQHRFVFAHLGGYQMWDEVEESLVGKPVWFDLSYTFEHLPDEEIERLIRAHGVERILYGSDYPWQTPAVARAGVERLGFTAEERARIMGENAHELLTG
jgi:predicted TIM-barrel fold metal-dependent hydrolase